jgi:hypothetical protein
MLTAKNHLRLTELLHVGFQGFNRTGPAVLHYKAYSKVVVHRYEYSVAPLGLLYAAPSGLKC